MITDINCDGKCLFMHFFSSSREAMFITAENGEFIDVNTAFTELFGYSRESLIGKNAGILYESADDREAYVNAIEKNEVVHDYQIVLKSSDGRNIFCLVDAVIWTDKDNQHRYCGIIRTKTEIMKSFRDYYNKLKEEREQIKEERKMLISESMLLMRYGSDELFDYIQKTGKNPLETKRKKVSILFFDIKGSTSIAEKLEPEIFADFLSDIFIDIMDLIYGNQGSVNKILGDGLMATFGAPMTTGMDAFNAVNTALKIQEYLTTYNDVRPDFLKSSLEAGIGIATGTVFAGVIGSIRREEYTVLGDSVNIAARLEKLTRKVSGNILIDELTYKELDKRFPAKKMFNCNLKGRHGVIKIFSI